ncbi:hypothetical protein [Rhodobacteraceae bacterium DSL-40]|uniref:hypothetical protein n=1 Tax=Amaricoccus sp. B4 TaxID=3368557 RepID=UPI0013A70C80
MVPTQIASGFRSGSHRIPNWAGAAFATIAVWAQTVPATAQNCGEEDPPLSRQVVMLASDEAGAILHDPRTGVLVSESGLVLSILNLSATATEINATDLLEAPLEKLKVQTWSDIVDRPAAAAGIIIGHDWRRNLVLVKIPDDEVTRLELVPATLAGFNDSSQDAVCLIGFRQNNQNRYRAEVPASVNPRPGLDIRWTVEHKIEREEIGGGIFDSIGGALLGIVESQDGDETRYLPVEYADTLMSQVYIALIMRQMDDLIRTSEQVQTGINWTYQIIGGSSDNEGGQRLHIRFFFDQYTDELAFDTVEVSTTLWGIDSRGERDISVALSAEDAREPVNLKEGSNYFDYYADKLFKKAQALGFTRLDRIRIKLKPAFHYPSGWRNSGPERRTSFELPISIDLKVEN